MLSSYRAYTDCAWLEMRLHVSIHLPESDGVWSYSCAHIHEPVAQTTIILPQPPSHVGGECDCSCCRLSDCLVIPQCLYQICLGGTLGERVEDIVQTGAILDGLTSSLHGHAWHCGKSITVVSRIIRPRARRLSGFSKWEVGLFSSVLIFHSKVRPPYMLYTQAHPSLITLVPGSQSQLDEKNSITANH